MFIREVGVGDSDLNVGIALDDSHGGWKPRIGCGPAHQTTEEAHIGALGCMRHRERAAIVVANVDTRNVMAHQVTGELPDAECGGAVAATWPAHHRTDDIIENTDQHAWLSHYTYECGDSPLCRFCGYFGCVKRPIQSAWIQR